MMTLEQLCLALETPLGKYECYSDVTVVAARRAIHARYSKLKQANPELSFSATSLRARVEWLDHALHHGEVDDAIEWLEP